MAQEWYTQQTAVCSKGLQLVEDRAHLSLVCYIIGANSQPQGLGECNSD